MLGLMSRQQKSLNRVRVTRNCLAKLDEQSGMGFVAVAGQVLHDKVLFTAEEFGKIVICFT